MCVYVPLGTILNIPMWLLWCVSTYIYSMVWRVCVCECVLVHTNWCLGLGSQHLLTAFLPRAREEEWLHNHMKDQKVGHQETQDFRISRRSFCPQTYPLHVSKFTLGFWRAKNPGSDSQSPALENKSERTDSDTIKFTASQPWLHLGIISGVLKDRNARAGSINQNLCGCGLGIFLGIQSSPGESDEWPGSRSRDGVQWFSRLCTLRIISRREWGQLGLGGGVWGLGKMHC